MHVLNQLFDKVMVINVKDHVERRERFTREANQVGLDFEIFPAFDREKLIEHGYLGPKFDVELPMIRTFVGRLGCALSHQAVIKQALDEKKSVLVFEDDASFPNNFNTRLEDLLKTLPDDWNVVRWGCGPEKGTRYPVNTDWVQLGTGWWGNFCYGVRGEMALKYFYAWGFISHGQHIDTCWRCAGFGDDNPDLKTYAPVHRFVRGGRPKNLKSNTALATEETKDHKRVYQEYVKKIQARIERGELR